MATTREAGINPAMEELVRTNYIGLSDVELDQYLYRIISVDRLVELFTNRQNVLVRPSQWDDPFENFVLKSQAKLSSGDVVTFDFNNDFYGQCWTTQKASDAMWRIYSPKSNGVRIRTTVRRLGDGLGKACGDWAHIQSFIGRVRYLKKKQMLDFANGVFANGLDATAFAKTLLVKRPAFRHEREVRLLYFEKENDRRGNNLFRYSIEPTELVDQVMIDPRLAKNDAAALKSEIKRRTGFGGQIKRSLLYAPPEGFIFPVGP